MLTIIFLKRDGRVAKHERTHVCTPWKIIGKVIDVNNRSSGQKLGSLSLITISKVLRNHPEIGEATRERDLARVKELDYRPNFQCTRGLMIG